MKHKLPIGLKYEQAFSRLLLQILILILLGTALKAQEPASEWTPLKGFHYTAKTIDGQSISIDSLIKAGKKVVIDFSGTYCDPCWRIHQRGTAEHLWQKFGPPGSDEVYFIWVEATGADREVIEGKRGNTKGDWTNGGTIPYPIVSDAHMADALGISLTYVPKVVLLSAHGTYTEVQELLLISEDGVYNKSKACLSEQDVPYIRSLYAPDWGMSTATPCEIQAYVGSVSPVTEYHWQVNGSDYVTTPEPRMILTWPTAEEITLSLTASNENGTSKPLSTRIRVRDGQESPSMLPLSESFEPEGLLDWSRADIDGDGLGWSLLSQELKRLEVSEQQLSAKTMAHSGEDCIISWSFCPTDFKGYTKLVGYKNSSKNWLLPPAVTIPEDEKEIHLTLYIRSFSKQFQRQDSLSIYYVPAPINPLLWQDGVTKLLTTPASYNWQKVQCDLSPFRGETVQLILAHETFGATGLLIDDVSIEIEDDRSISSIGSDRYPSVSILNGSPYITCSSDVHWRLYRPSGLLQAEGEVSPGTHELTLESLPRGLYILSIETATGERVALKIEMP